ncbi:hypothetical protein KIPB_005102 [Kipferlia bialata]|uniref:Kelch-type beta propeller n=1 Tax=Kipferlia bialata TaxID=797122 RepID=A0A391NTW9_9EUKA|nr:hypothetical protein KIPB_005102 [Kipferlia bialata]|eukprot:g5102.t1
MNTVPAGVADESASRDSTGHLAVLTDVSPSAESLSQSSRDIELPQDDDPVYDGRGPGSSNRSPRRQNLVPSSRSSLDDVADQVVGDDDTDGEGEEGTPGEESLDLDDVDDADQSYHSQMMSGIFPSNMSAEDARAAEGMMAVHIPDGMTMADVSKMMTEAEITRTLPPGATPPPSQLLPKGALPHLPPSPEQDHVEVDTENPDAPRRTQLIPPPPKAPKDSKDWWSPEEKPEPDVMSLGMYDDYVPLEFQGIKLKHRSFKWSAVVSLEHSRVMVLGENSNRENYHCYIINFSGGNRVVEHRIRCPIDRGLDNFTATLGPNGRYVYIYGGAHWNCHKRFSDVWVFDTKRVTWRKVQQKGQRPCARFSHASFLMDNLIIICGGYNYKRRLNDCWAFDPQTEVWQKLVDPPMRFKASACAVVDGVAHIFGNIVEEVNCYTHISFSLRDGWKRYPDMPFRCIWSATLTVGRFAVVLGGRYHERRIHAYDTETHQWYSWGSFPKNFHFTYGKGVQINRRICFLHTENGSMVVHLNPLFTNKADFHLFPHGKTKGAGQRNYHLYNSQIVSFQSGVVTAIPIRPPEDMIIKPGTHGCG